MKEEQFEMVNLYNFLPFNLVVKRIKERQRVLRNFETIVSVLTVVVVVEVALT